MKKVFVIAIILGFWTSGVITAEGLEIPVCTDPSGQYDPDIWGANVVWTDYRNAQSNSDNLDIYMYNLLTRTETRITNAQNTQTAPSIWGNTIAWVDYRNGSGNEDIYMYDISTGVETQVSSRPGGQRPPVVWGNKIAYQDNGGIYLYDISTKAETVIASGTFGQPAIWGSRIIFTGGLDSKEVYMFNVLTGTTSLLPTDSSRKGQLSIWGDKIAWTVPGDGVYLYDISTGQAIRLGFGLEPELWGDRVAYARGGIGGIIVYDISAGREVLTIDSAYQPSMWDGMIVYEDIRLFGDPNIYLQTVNPVPEPSTMLLLGSGLVGLIGFRRRLRK